jgi:hypothetical protein
MRLWSSSTSALACQWATHSAYTWYRRCLGLLGWLGVAIDPTGPFCYVTAYFVGVANFGNSGSGDVLVTCTKNFVGNQKLNDYYVAKLRASDGTPVWAVNGVGTPDSDDETRVSPSTPRAIHTLLVSCTQTRAPLRQ